MENDTINTIDNKEVAEKLNNFFIEAVENLGIETFYPDIVYTENINEIIKNYKTHRSILKIKEKVNAKSKFFFSGTTPNDFKDEVRKLDSQKASTENDIPTKIYIYIFYANHPLQGFRSHCSVRGYYSLLVATAGAESTTRTGRQHTHAHTHTHTTPNSTLYYLQT